MVMNHIDYTVFKIEELLEKMEYIPAIAIIGAEFNVPGTIDREFDCYQPRKGQGIEEFCSECLMNSPLNFMDAVMLPRVFEHFSLRFVDWYLYNISLIMEDDGEIICLVPDMHQISVKLREEFSKRRPNIFLTQRLQYSLLSEGDDVMWRHSIWTDENSMKYYLEREKLFKVISIKPIQMDTDIVPPDLEVIARRV